jgi:hypothetical protein
MKRFPVICLQCGLSVDRLVDAETAQTEIHRVTYQQKCKVAPDAADFDCPELEHAVERSRRWDPIFRSGTYRPVSSDDAVVFPEALSEAAVKNQELVAEKAEPSAEAAELRAEALSGAAVVAEKAEPSAEVASLRARVGAMDMADAAPATPVDLDELRDALSKALELSATSISTAGDDAGT